MFIKIGEFKLININLVVSVQYGKKVGRALPYFITISMVNGEEHNLFFCDNEIDYSKYCDILENFKNINNI